MSIIYTSMRPNTAFKQVPESKKATPNKQGLFIDKIGDTEYICRYDINNNVVVVQKIN